MDNVPLLLGFSMSNSTLLQKIRLMNLFAEFNSYLKPLTEIEFNTYHVTAEDVADWAMARVVPKVVYFS